MTGIVFQSICQTFNPVNPSNINNQTDLNNPYNKNKSILVNPTMQSYQQQNRQVMEKLGYAPLPTQEEINSGQYAQSLEVRRQARIRLVREILYEDKKELKEKQINAKDLAFKKSERIYFNSAKEIINMLNGKKPLDIKRAIFLTENAYYDSTLSYKNFINQINEIVTICKTVAENEKLDYNNKYIRAAILKRYFSDTIIYKSNDKTQIHIPYKYDFEDYNGDKDWSKMFVTKLLNSNSGQCHSLPFLFRVVAQEMNINAYLCFSPNHCYIKLKAEDGYLYSFETTNKNFVADSWVLSSGYIKANAIRSQIYMDTLTAKETLAQCLVDIAQGYINKWGYDDFVTDCAETALHFHKNNIHAIQLMADCCTMEFRKEVRKYNNPPIEKLNQYPSLKDKYDFMLRHYEQVDNMGYEEMPKEAYEAWLGTVENEKFKQFTNSLNNKFQQTINQKK
jgi:hypothetical protein